MRYKILTVDDSKTVRIIVKKAFKTYDCEIIEASNGVEGLATAAKEAPDVILLDVTMPVMDGVEMLTKLNGKAIRIPGFMVPLDDMDYESVGRFLLVPDPQACIHVPPPPANQMIYVVMKGKKKAPVTWGVPVVLAGELKVKSIRSQFGVVSFQVAGESVKPYTGK